MPYTASPDLAGMFGSMSPVPYLAALNQEEAASRGRTLQNDQALETLNFDKAVNPLKIVDAGITTAGRIRDEDLASSLYPDVKRNAQAKIDSERTKFTSQQLDSLGNQLMQIGTAAKANGGMLPLSITNNVDPKIIQMLQQPGGHDAVFALGKALRDNSTAWTKQESKQDSAEGIAADKEATRQAAIKAQNERAAADRESRERIAAMRVAAQKLLADKRGSANDKQSLEQYLVALDRQRNTVAIDDPQAYAALSQRMAEIQNRIEKIKSAGAAEQGSLPRDLMGKTTPQSGPRANTQPQGATAPAATQQGRIKVTSPDGKVGTIPADQLKDALSQGYKEYK